MAKTSKKAAVRRIRFTVRTMVPLPVGGQVFVTGNQEGLGQWRPDAVPLARLDDFVWTGMVAVPGRRRIEYKLTCGSWESEEALSDGSVPDGHVLPAGKDCEVDHLVHHWLNDPPERLSRITGRYRIHDRVSSAFLSRARRVMVWLPPSYETSPDRSYPVLYMHDGQQLFDPATSTHGADWQVDEWCEKLIGEGRLRELLVVGVFNTPERMQEYNPADRGGDYSRFLIEELKPFIDETYRTQPGRDHTAVAGSSMGGLISFDLAWKHPEVFFGAACLSPAFEPSRGAAYDLEIVKQAESVPDTRLYLYCGGGDELERHLPEGTRRLRDLLKEKRFEEGRKLAYVEDAEAPHTEAAWARHTDHWLLFLFGREF